MEDAKPSGRESPADDAPQTAAAAEEQGLLALAGRVRAAESRFDGTFEQAAVGIAHVRPDGLFLRVNQRFCEIVGYSRAELLERRFQELTHADDAEKDRASIRQLLAGEVATHRREKRYRRKDGAWVWVNLTTSLVRGADGDPEYFMSVVEDITERRQAEDSLREREERFRRTFDQAPIAQAIVALDGRFQRVNAALCRITGYSAEELGELTFTDITHPEDRAVSLEKTRQLLTGEVESFQLDKRYLRKDGATVWARTWACLIKDAQGRPLYTLPIVEDISAQKRAEEELRQRTEEKDGLQRQLVEAQKLEAIGRLAGGIAHDFNNLLTAMLGYSDLAAASLPSDSRAARHIASIRDVVRQSQGLTQQILAFSRRQVLRMDVVDINAELLAASEVLRRLIGEDVEVQTVLQPALGRVRADSSQLQQVLVNLAVNARDAMPEGGRLTLSTRDVRLAADAARSAPEMLAGDYVLLTVEDTGRGMDPAVLGRIFEPFFTTKERGRGTGLGLATVYGIVKQHRGHIDVQSAPGVGTTFRIYFPRIDGTPEAVLAKGSPPAPARGEETILLAEDDPSVRDLLAGQLSACGYRVLAAADSQRALELARQHRGPIDILLTDVVMPGANGRELYSRLVVERPGLSVLYMSGYAGETLGRRNEGLEEGLRFIQKPFDIGELTRQIREILDGGR